MSDTRKDTVLRSVRLPAHVDAAVRLRAAELDRSLSWVIVRALEEHEEARVRHAAASRPAKDWKSTPGEVLVGEAVREAASGSSAVPLPLKERISPVAVRASQLKPRGCKVHPGAKASESKGKWWCAEPGCTSPAGWS